MKGLYAPPELLAAYAYGVYEGDPDLVWGTHLRVFAGLGASWPLAPFAVFKLSSPVTESPPIDVAIRDGYMDVTILPWSGDRFHYVRVTLRDDDGRYERVELRDQNDRLVAARERPPWQFAAPVLHMLRVWGDMDPGALRIDGIAFELETLLELPFEPQDATVLGLPVDGRFRWYSGLHDIAGGIDRAVRGAPLRLAPPDRPDGPFDLADPFDAMEKMRLQALLDLHTLPGGGLAQLLANLVDDELPPWKQNDAQPFDGADGRRHFVRAARMAQLQMALFDPGVSRMCGFADLIEDEAALDHHDFWDTLAVVGLFAFDADAYLARDIDLTQPDPDAGRLFELLVAALNANVPGRDWNGELAQSSEFARERGLTVAPFVTLVGPARPWLPPGLPLPTLRDHRWQPSDGSRPSDHYRATFVFDGAPGTALAAQGMLLDGTWQTRHQLLDIGQFDPPQRALAAILGVSGHGSAQVGLLSDQNLPAGAGDIAYRVHAADYFGRFGSPTDFVLAPPPRPLPPPPTLRYQIVPDEAIDPLSSAPVSPGTLRLTVALGQPGQNPFSQREGELLGTAIVVPRLEDLAAGAFPLAALALTFDDTDLPLVDLTQPGIITVDWPLPALEPQAQSIWKLSGFFSDAAGNETPLELRPGVAITVTDRRPPPVYPSGVGLLWTSAPGPAPDVELTLQWQAAPGSHHKVYLTDRYGLGLTDAVIGEVLENEGLGAAWQPGGAPPSRGLVAAVGCKRVKNEPTAVAKDTFRLLTDPPLTADAAGQVLLRTTLPRSLATVQFLRVVPLGPDGAEPPFEDCGIIPVAVPESRRPPAPQLSGSVDPATGVATLMVTADGFNLPLLAADEPGLFTPGADGDEPPRSRLRRAIGSVAAPIYAQPLGDERTLVLSAQDEAPPVFSTLFSDDDGGAGLAPFVPCVYWAEVRLPDERRLPAGWDEEAEPDRVMPLYPAHERSHPRPFSLPSPPLTLMHVPPEAPAALAVDAITVLRQPPDAQDRVTLTLTLADPPHSHRKAVDKYRLAVWGQWPDQPLQPLREADDAWPVAEDGSVSVLMSPPEQGAATGPLWLRLALVDPVGRYGAFAPPLLVEEPPLPLPLPPVLSAVEIRGTAIAGRPVVFASWQILQPAPPDPLAEYMLTVRVEQHGGLPLTLNNTLDEVPELTLLGLLALRIKQLARLAGHQQYVLRLNRNRPVRVEVTLTDRLGQSVTESGQLGL